MMDCSTYMCEEIVIEILARLPAKSLIRSMAVCRLWKSIITSPQFRLVSNLPTRLLVHTDGECYSFVEDGEENHLMFETYFPSKHGAVVIGSDNGLICIGITGPNLVIIWNPFIRKHVVIPDHHMDDVFAVTTEYASGFGDYKYVRLVAFSDGGGSLKKVADIYSLNAGTWRRKYLDSNISPSMVGGKYKTCALLRGRLHWVGCGNKNEICPFELEDEVFEDKIVVPESIQSPRIRTNVTVIRESLAVITAEIERGCSSVWVMEEYGDVNSWTKLYDIALEIFCWIERNTVHLLKNGEVLLGLSGIVCLNKQKLVTYNPKTVKTCDSGDGLLSLFSEVRGFTNNYKESLVLLGDHRAVGNQPIQQGHRKYNYPARTGGFW